MLNNYFNSYSTQGEDKKPKKVRNINNQGKEKIKQ